MASPRAYNDRQIADGMIGGAEVAAMTRLFQAQNGLVVDGKCGPATLAILRPDDKPSAWGLKMLEVALSCLGKGESPGCNNSGPFVAMLHGLDPASSDRDQGAWCGAFVGWCMEQAAAELGVEPLKRSGGAKAQFRIIAAAGRRVADCLPGDVIVWDRGRPGSWQGHIGIVRAPGSVLRTVEGNRGRCPALVSEFQYDPDDMPRLLGFARLPHV